MIFFFNLEKNLEQLRTIVISLGKIYSVIMAPENFHWCQYGVFITNFEHIWSLILRCSLKIDVPYVKRRNLDDFIKNFKKDPWMSSFVSKTAGL